MRTAKTKKKQSKVQQNLVLALIPYNEVTIECIKEPFKATCLQQYPVFSLMSKLMCIRTMSSNHKHLVSV